MDTREKISFSEFKEDVNIDDIRSIIFELKKTGMDNFFTSDIIRLYTGSFNKNHNTPPSLSFNANMGKLLKHEYNYFGIRKNRKSVSINDDNGETTHSSEWAFL